MEAQTSLDKIKQLSYGKLEYNLPSPLAIFMTCFIFEKSCRLHQQFVCYNNIFHRTKEEEQRVDANSAGEKGFFF